jgi:hypothetical protein
MTLCPTGIKNQCSRFDALEGNGRLTRECEIADHVAAMLSLPAYRSFRLRHNSRSEVVPYRSINSDC